MVGMAIFSNLDKSRSKRFSKKSFCKFV